VNYVASACQGRVNGMFESKNLYAELILLVVAFFWGVNPAVMKIGIAVIPAMSYNALRLLVAVVIGWIAVYFE